MNRIFHFLILPLLSIIGIGALLNHFDYGYIEQYMIAAGPILAAFVALFISKNAEHLAKEKEFSKRETIVEHLYTLLNESEKVLTEEINNYQQFSTALATKGLNQLYLKTTPFYFIEEISNQNYGELYDSIVKRKGPQDSNKLRRIYLECIKHIENAIFIKRNAEFQYKQFIESYNGHARQWKEGQLGLNKLHADITTLPSNNKDFDIGYLTIVHNYNHLIHNGKISIFSISDIRAHLFEPLVQHLNSNFFAHYYVSTLQQTLKLIEVSLDKMEDTQNITRAHFDQIKQQLAKIRQDLVENKEKLNGSLQAAIEMP